METRDFARQPRGIVLNQPSPLEDYNLYEWDTPLREAVARENAGWADDELHEYGEVLGRAETLRLGELANEVEPVLYTHDRAGARADRVEFHPAYHELMRLGIERGIHSSVWADSGPGAHVARGAKMHLRHQVEQGTSCPLTMTFAVVPSLRRQPNVADAWLPKVMSRTYDHRLVPASEKKGVTFGMFLTERQGGSDVRSNNTTATPIGAGGAGGEYLIEGHKWFCSAPMCDAFLVLAQAPDGLSCFLMPRFRPGGERNPLHIQRLKPKLGNRSNASSEIEIDGAWAQMVGEPGRGVATIIEMVRHTRLDCALGGASLIRRAVAEAGHFVRHRWAFNRRLIDQPLMQNVLADLCLESEAATALTYRLARSFDEAAHDAGAAAFSRIATPVTKYWVNKRETVAVREAMECFGGNGYVEEGPMPRLFRESPLNSIWEGTGNVQCLDLMRAIAREPAALGAYFDEVELAAGSSRAFDQAVTSVRSAFEDRETLEVRARTVVERMALLLQASLLVRSAPTAVSDAFVASRIAGDHGGALGTLPAGLDYAAIIERSLPVVG